MFYCMLPLSSTQLSYLLSVWNKLYAVISPNLICFFYHVWSKLYHWLIRDYTEAILREFIHPTPPEIITAQLLPGVPWYEANWVLYSFHFVVCIQRDKIFRRLNKQVGIYLSPGHRSMFQSQTRAHASYHRPAHTRSIRNVLNTIDITSILTTVDHSLLNTIDIHSTLMPHQPEALCDFWAVLCPADLDLRPRIRSFLDFRAL